MSWRALSLAVLVVVLLIVVATVGLGRLAVRRYEDYLSGLWVGDPGFLAQAQLSDVQLFLAPREAGSRGREGYLIMTDSNGEFLANQGFEFRARSAVRRWSTALRSLLRTKTDVYKSARVEIDFDDTDAASSPPLPNSLKMALSMGDGSLTLYDDERVYAFLYKDPAASAAALEAYDA